MRSHVQVFDKEWRGQRKELGKASNDGSEAKSCREGGVSLIPQGILQ